MQHNILDLHAAAPIMSAIEYGFLATHSRAAIKSATVWRKMGFGPVSQVRQVMLDAANALDGTAFFVEMRPNRSLTVRGRRFWFAAIAGTTFLLAGLATVVGAWLVLPFAGLEIVVLWYAFRLIARHDGDYEWVRVTGRQFCWTKCESGRYEVLAGNAAWVQVSSISRHGRVEIGLRYQGRTVSVGKMISDEQRAMLGRNLVRVLQ